MEIIKLSFGGGGGGGQTQAHTHNPAIINDGGELSTSSPTTITSMPVQTYVMVFG
jgi:hypothetical protein